MAIASIQSAATFPDPNVKYVFRTENGGQVREGARWLQVLPGVGIEGGNGTCLGRPGLEDEVKMGTVGAGWGANRRDWCGMGYAETSVWGKKGEWLALCLKDSCFGTQFKGSFIRGPRIPST